MNGAQPHFDRDLRAGQQAEAFVFDMLDSLGRGSTQIEVKTCWTRDYFIEVWHKPITEWVPSGLSVTTALTWCFALADTSNRIETVLFVPTDRLRQWVKTQHDAGVAWVEGGKNGSCPTRGLFVPVGVLAQWMADRRWEVGTTS